MEESVESFIAIADRGYRNEVFMEILSTVELRSVFVVPNYSLQVQTFMGLSFLSLSREEIVDESAANEKVWKGTCMESMISRALLFATKRIFVYRW